MVAHRKLIQAHLAPDETLREVYYLDESETLALTNRRFMRIEQDTNGSRDKAEMQTTSLKGVANCSFIQYGEEPHDLEKFLWGIGIAFVGVLAMAASIGPRNFSGESVILVLGLGIVVVGGVIIADSFSTGEGYVEIQLQSEDIDEKLRLPLDAEEFAREMVATLGESSH